MMMVGYRVGICRCLKYVGERRKIKKRSLDIILGILTQVINITEEIDQRLV